MSSLDYASAIKGFRRFQETGDRSDYQPTGAYSHESAMQLMTDLPEACQICFFDPEKKEEEAYIFVRRAGSRYMVMRGGHGWSSRWKEEPLSRIVRLFAESPLVKKPCDDFESFSVMLVPEHQRRWHLA